MKHRYLLPLILLAGCGQPPIEPDPMDPLIEKIRVEDLWAEDIEKLKDVIDDAAEAGAYENIDVLFQLATKNGFKEVRMAAGAAIEKITGEKFGIGASDERVRMQGLRKARQWWSTNRDIKLNAVLVERLIPYLERPFGDVGDISYHERVLAALPQDSYSDAGYAIEVLKQTGPSIHKKLRKLIEDKSTEQLAREKLALVLEGYPDMELPKVIPDILEDCEDPVMRGALLRVWGRQDKDNAYAVAWKDFEDAKNKGREAHYLAVAYSISPDRVAGWCGKQIVDGTSEEAANAGYTCGSYGFSEHLVALYERSIDKHEGEVIDALINVTPALGPRRVPQWILSDLLEMPYEKREVALEILVVLSAGLDEFEIIQLLDSKEIEVRKAAALMLQKQGSKSAAAKLIQALALDGDHTEIFVALDFLTGRDFKVYDQDEYEKYAKSEGGSRRSAERKFIANRAHLWWVHHRSESRAQWLVTALNASGFSSIREDNHPMSTREMVLLSRLLETDYPLRREALAVLITTNETVNIDFVVKWIERSRDGYWAAVLRPLVDRAEDERSGEFGRLFCSIAGHQYHRHLHALLRSQDRSLVMAAAGALDRWKGFKEIENLIEDIESGSGERPHIANNLLKSITGLNFGNIVGITTPERKTVVDQWKSWWRRVHDERFPSSWKIKEISFLIGELGTRNSSKQLRQRFAMITHWDPFMTNTDVLRKRWGRHKLIWGSNGTDVLDVMSNNPFRVDRAWERLKQSATERDIAHMIRALDPSDMHETNRLLMVIRSLTGLDYGYHSKLDRKARRNIISEWTSALFEGRIPRKLLTTGSVQ